MAEEKDRELINKVMTEPVVMDALRESDPKIDIKLAAYEISFWLPRGKERKVVLLVFFCASIYALINESYIFFIFFILLCALMSPKIVGILAIFYGKYLRRNK